MKYKNYTITRHDNLNWKLVRSHLSTPTRPSASREGAVVTSGDETPPGESFAGYYSDVFSALRGIVKAEAGKGCEDITELLEQVTELVSSIKATEIK
jgi:hypothetical protein